MSKHHEPSAITLRLVKILLDAKNKFDGKHSRDCSCRTSTAGFHIHPREPVKLFESQLNKERGSVI